jgi:hypothetical protein
MQMGKRFQEVEAISKLIEYAYVKLGILEEPESFQVSRNCYQK